MLPDFVKRFTKLGAIYGLISGAAYPFLMMFVGPFLMDLYMRVYNALSTNGHIGYATQIGNAPPADPTSARNLIMGTLFYLWLFGGAGLIGGTIAGAICGLATGLFTCQFFYAISDARRYRLALAAIAGIFALITSLLLFGGILTAMFQDIFLAIPASLIVTTVAVIASHQIAEWYLESLSALA